MLIAYQKPNQHNSSVIKQIKTIYRHNCLKIGKDKAKLVELKTREQGILECQADLERLVSGREFYLEKAARIRDSLKPQDLESLEEKFANLDQRIEDLKDILETYKACVG